MHRAAVVVIVSGLVSPSFAGPGPGAFRDLPAGDYLPGSALSVSIAINPPGGTTVVGLEDAPPAGWTVSSISHSGSFDVPTGKVKWGPFIAPSIPASVSYDVTPAAGKTGQRCFLGTVSFGGADQPVGGDGCLTRAPAATAIGLALLFGSMILAGSRVLIVRRQPDSLREG